MRDRVLRLPLAVLAVALCVVCARAGAQTATTASDCVGKPYGYPGCPIRTSSSASSNPNSLQCGDGVIETGETCDNGHLNGYSNCGSNCQLLYCGDGIVSPDIDEECDPEFKEYYVQEANGNLVTERRYNPPPSCGWYCTPPTCTTAGGSNCTGGCKMQFFGQCSELPATSTGALATSSSLVSSSASTLPWSAPASSSVPATVSSAASSAPSRPACGNGIVELAEACDDGVYNSNFQPNACRTNCQLARCGDGIVDKDEQCDDGNANDGDSCSNVCQLSRCGDGVLQKNEMCDDGPNNSDTVTGACRTNCQKAKCGDGIVDAGELCDMGAQNSNTRANACRTTCQLPSCGDGVTDSSEECDWGIRNSDTQPDACRPTCKLPICGDGVADRGEECDWGPRNSNTEKDACRTTCVTPRCGDGAIDTNEECDGGEGCGPECKLLHPAAESASGESSASSAATDSGMLLINPEPTVPVEMAPAASTSFTPRTYMTIGVIAAALLMLGLLGFVFRDSILSLFRSTVSRSLDDIPLDQIEMPWHKW